MKKYLYRNIEEDVKNIGVNDRYPTQFVLNISDLKKVSEPTNEKPGVYVVDGTNIKVLVTMDRRVEVNIDGFRYIPCSCNYGSSNENPFERFDFGDGQMGCLILGLTDERIAEGVVMSDGMMTYEEGKETTAVETKWEYDGESELEAVICKTSDGEKTMETFIGTNWYRDKDPGYSEELLEKYKKESSFGSK